MSRVAKLPVVIPNGVEARVESTSIEVKGPKGALALCLSESVDVSIGQGFVQVRARPGADNAKAMSGTIRALINNMVRGVHLGFERKLNLIGVGYRAQAQGKTLNLTLGFSHPISYAVPDGITIETPSQTEIVVRGADKQQVGQVAAEIRAFRPPEPYKGKGVKYSDEVVVRKEAKKK